MNIDMRNISPDMEKAINKIMETHGYNAATKAITRAVTDHISMRERIETLYRKNEEIKNELNEERKKTEKTVKYLKFFRDLIEEDT